MWAVQREKDQSLSISSSALPCQHLLPTDIDHTHATLTARYSCCMNKALRKQKLNVKKKWSSCFGLCVKLWPRLHTVSNVVMSVMGNWGDCCKFEKALHTSLLFCWYISISLNNISIRQSKVLILCLLGVSGRQTQLCTLSYISCTLLLSGVLLSPYCFLCKPSHQWWSATTPLLHWCSRIKKHLLTTSVCPVHPVWRAKVKPELSRILFQK